MNNNDLTYQGLAELLNKFFSSRGAREKESIEYHLKTLCAPKDQIPVYILKKFTSLNTKDFLKVATDLYLTAKKIKGNEFNETEYCKQLITDCFKLK